jgi:DNA-binding CsgD family transcriptional regulator
MIRLSSEILTQAHEFILDLHATTEVETLRTVAPQGISRLIRCDRAAFNEFDAGSLKCRIVPTPVPTYWQRLGPVMVAHVHEHVLINPANVPVPHRSVKFGHGPSSAICPRSTLYNEYYLPAGARHQLAIYVTQRREVRYVLNCNRWSHDFSDEDSAVLELISPHVEYAWRNACALTQLRHIEELGNWERARQHTVIVDCAKWVATSLSFGAQEVIRGYFAEHLEEGCPVPDRLGRWIRMQREALKTSAVFDGAPQPLALKMGHGTLHLRLVLAAPPIVVLLLEERPIIPLPRTGAVPRVTPREGEILHWMREGKRNGEIATILGLSTRTVGKHLENIFQKLGVETRTAAVHAVFDPRQNRSNAQNEPRRK